MTLDSFLRTAILVISLDASRFQSLSGWLKESQCATKHIFQDAMPIPHSMLRFIQWRLIVRHSAHAVHHQRRGANLAYAGLASQF